MDLEGQPGYLIACRSRAGALAWAAVILVAAVVLVGQWHGVRALLGLGLSFLIVFVYIIPRIAAGGPRSACRSWAWGPPCPWPTIWPTG